MNSDLLEKSTIVQARLGECQSCWFWGGKKVFPKTGEDVFLDLTCFSELRQLEQLPEPEFSLPFTSFMDPFIVITFLVNTQG